MDQDTTQRSERICNALRSASIGLSLLMLPPFLVLAVAPMLLFLCPVAMVAIPFVIPALLSGSLATSRERPKRMTWKPLASPAASWV